MGERNSAQAALVLTGAATQSRRKAKASALKIALKKVAPGSSPVVV
jgi:hypothetical protein